MSASSHLTEVAQDGFAWQLLQAMPEAVFLVNVESLTILASNSEATRLADRAQDELAGLPVAEILAGTAGISLSTIWKRFSEPTSNSQGVQVRLVTKDCQHSLPIRATCRLIEADHQATGMITLHQLDHDHPKQRKSEPQNSVIKLEEIFEALKGFAWEFDPIAGVFTYVSPRVEAVFGYPASDWIDNPEFFPSILHPDDRDSVLNFCATETSAVLDHSMTYRMQAADGSVNWVRDIVYLVKNEAGSVTSLRGLMIDITDERHLKERLIESEARYRRMFDESPVAQFWSASLKLIHML